MKRVLLVFVLSFLFFGFFPSKAKADEIDFQELFAMMDQAFTSTDLFSDDAMDAYRKEQNGKDVKAIRKLVVESTQISGMFLALASSLEHEELPRLSEVDEVDRKLHELLDFFREDLSEALKEKLSQYTSLSEEQLSYIDSKLHGYLDVVSTTRASAKLLEIVTDRIEDENLEKETATALGIESVVFQMESLECLGEKSKVWENKYVGTCLVTGIAVTSPISDRKGIPTVFEITVYEKGSERDRSISVSILSKED